MVHGIKLNIARRVCVGFVVLANAAFASAQSDEIPGSLRERISRSLVRGGHPSALAAFDTEVKITAGDAAFFDQFGVSVSVSGDTAIVGAWANDDAGSESGSAYIFGRDVGGPDNWGEVKKLTASDAAAADQFGVSASVSGDTAIVGAWFDDDDGGESGSAYIYFVEPSAPIPAMSEWGVIVLTLLLLAAGTVTCRRAFQPPQSAG